MIRIVVVLVALALAALLSMPGLFEAPSRRPPGRGGYDARKRRGLHGKPAGDVNELFRNAGNRRWGR